jgi:hypothetical protein
MKQVLGRDGGVATVPAARAKDARRSNVHWLTPRTWRLWTDVGLRGHGRDGVPAAGWEGRLEDRNVAFVRLLVSSGLRRSEGGSLLTFEVPEVRLGAGRYYRGKVMAGPTRSKKSRVFYAAADAVADITAYVESSRAWAVREAQRKGRVGLQRRARVLGRAGADDRDGGEPGEPHQPVPGGPLGVLRGGDLHRGPLVLGDDLPGPLPHRDRHLPPGPLPHDRPLSRPRGQRLQHDTERPPATPASSSGARTVHHAPERGHCCTQYDTLTAPSWTYRPGSDSACTGPACRGSVPGFRAVPVALLARARRASRTASLPGS